MLCNKVVHGKTVLIDLTGDNISAGEMLKGTAAHNAAGEIINGALPIGIIHNETVIFLPNQTSTEGEVLTIPAGKASVSGDTLYL